MKAFIVLCLFGVASMAVARPEQYSNRYDGIDLDQILANRRLLDPYVLCVLGKGRCTPEGKELKSHIQEALEQDCAKCTPAQRSGTDKVIAHLIKHEPKYWTELKDKFDPSGKYVQRHERELNQLGVAY